MSLKLFIATASLLTAHAAFGEELEVETPKTPVTVPISDAQILLPNDRRLFDDSFMVTGGVEGSDDIVFDLHCGLTTKGTLDLKNVRKRFVDLSTSQYSEYQKKDSAVIAINYDPKIGVDHRQMFLVQMKDGALTTLHSCSYDQQKPQNFQKCSSVAEQPPRTAAEMRKLGHSLEAECRHYMDVTTFPPLAPDRHYAAQAVRPREYDDDRQKQLEMLRQP